MAGHGAEVGELAGLPEPNDELGRVARLNKGRGLATAFMADSRVPWGVDALGGTISEPAWRNKPSWYLLTTEDRMIPPQAQQMMSERAGATVEEVAASHSVYVSQPAAVAAIIEKAASAT